MRLFLDPGFDPGVSDLAHARYVLRSRLMFGQLFLSQFFKEILDQTHLPRSSRNGPAQGPLSGACSVALLSRLSSLA